MIRELQWNDFDDLVTAYYSYYDEVKENHDLGLIFYHEKPNMVHEINWFRDLYADFQTGNAVALVLEEDGMAVGICDVRRVRPGSEVSHSGNLGIAIRDGYRDHGNGQKLVKAVLEACRGKFEIIVLSVFTLNRKALHIYEKLGFVKYGTLPKSVLRNGRYFDEYHMYYEVPK